MLTISDFKENTLTSKQQVKIQGGANYQRYLVDECLSSSLGIPVGLYIINTDNGDLYDALGLYVCTIGGTQ